MTKFNESNPAAVAATAPDALTMREDPTTIVDSAELSSKARLLGSKLVHKTMYVQRKEAPRNEMIYFGDKTSGFSRKLHVRLLQTCLTGKHPC